MMYFNFLHAPSGGGLQNSASFLQTLVDRKADWESVCCFVFEGSALESICIKNSIDFISVRNSLVGKMLFELSFFYKIRKGDIVFSIFGPPLFFTEGKSINVGGIAISNVFYPEIDFWGYLSPLKKQIKYLKDKYRVYRYKKLDFWIFETDLLAEKAVKKYKFPEERVSVVKMAPSALVSQDKITNFNPHAFEQHKIKILLLCSAHPNKRHHLLPPLARALKKSGYNDIQFIFTASSNEYLTSVYSCIHKLDVKEYFINVGPVEPSNVANLICSVDFVMNISLLESFSNNFVEAWAMRKPLITVSDEWASLAAKKAALYIDIQNDIIQIDSFLAAIGSDREEIIDNGLIMLRNQPTAEQKNNLYMDVIKRAMSLGSLDRNIKKGITLR